MNIRTIPLLLSATLLSACGPNQSDVKISKAKEFDIFCEQFSKVTKTKNFERFTPEERAKLLDEKISKEISTSGDAYIAWSAIQNATPSQRAGLYIDAAISAGNASWECTAIDNFADQVGSN